MNTALDSNVFIAFLAEDPDFFDAAAEIMRKIENGQLNAAYSSLVFGEVTRMPIDESLEPIKQFFNKLPGTDYPADKAVCTKAAELRRKYPGLKLPDAIHLATAIHSKANNFITADKSLARIAKKEINATYLKEFHGKV